MSLQEGQPISKKGPISGQKKEEWVASGVTKPASQSQHQDDVRTRVAKGAKAARVNGVPAI